MNYLAEVLRLAQTLIVGINLPMFMKLKLHFLITRLPFLIVIGLVSCNQFEDGYFVRPIEVLTGSEDASTAESDLSVSSLQDQSLAILESKCASCHNLENGQGGFATVLDVEEMLKSGRYVIAGDPDKSEIINRLAPAGNMPPSGEISESEVSTLRSWIKEIQIEALEPILKTQEIKLVRDDLEKNIPAAARPFVRYFTLRNLHNSGAAEETMAAFRGGLAKVLNSLSLSAKLVNPKSIDEKQLIFRVDLRDLALDRLEFNTAIGDFYPFIVNLVPLSNDPEHEIAVNSHNFLSEEIGTPNYLIRADWFTSTAPLPVLYKRFLKLEDNLTDLETRLGVNRQANIVNNQVLRSGFRNSGVSSQNRMIERHVSSTSSLPYWISYDFADNNDGQQNIFNFPLGPTGVGFEQKAFDHDGGEVIFQLPNGLFGYYLTLADGSSIDKGPLNIVSQINGPKQFFQAIVNGVSCMSCHGQGLLYKKDDIRDFVAVSQDFSALEKNKVFNLFPDADQFKAIMDSDNKRYFESLQAIGVDPKEPDPVNIAYAYYNKNLFRTDVQAELGVNDQAFDAMLNAEPFKSAWISVYTNSGSITRNEFNLLYGLGVQNYVNGAEWLEPNIGDHLATPACMVADASQMANCIVDFSREVPPVVVQPEDVVAASLEGN